MVMSPPPVLFPRAAPFLAVSKKTFEHSASLVGDEAQSDCVRARAYLGEDSEERSLSLR